MARDMNIEVEPIAVTQLTGRMGYLLADRGGKSWRGELLASGRMGAVTCNGAAAGKVPVWFQRQMARATVLLQGAAS